MKKISIIWLSVFLGLAGSAFAGQKSISKSSFNSKWPFTINQGILECRELILPTGRKIPMVLFHANGKIYGVNGTAAARYQSIDEIWLDNPNIRGTKINVGPIIDEGLKLCN